jgi:hypothetical protein
MGKIDCDGGRPRCQKCVLIGFPYVYDVSHGKANTSKTPSHANWMLIERYLQRPHEQIRLLKDEVDNKKHGEESSDKSLVLRTSGYGEQSIRVWLLKRISAKCSSGERCLKVLEVLHSKISNTSLLPQFQADATTRPSPTSQVPPDPGMQQENMQF